MESVKVRYSEEYNIEMPGPIEVVAKTIVKNRKGAKYRLFKNDSGAYVSGYVVVPGMKKSIGLEVLA